MFQIGDLVCAKENPHSKKISPESFYIGMILELDETCGNYRVLTLHCSFLGHQHHVELRKESGQRNYVMKFFENPIPENMTHIRYQGPLEFPKNIVYLVTPKRLHRIHSIQEGLDYMHSLTPGIPKKFYGTCYTPSFCFDAMPSSPPLV